MEILLKSLLAKLTPLSKASLEQAVQFCMSKRKNVVELDHWLITLLENDNSALHAIAKYFEVDIDLVLRKLHQAQYQVVSETSTVPSLARSLIDIIEDSWLLGSIELGASQLNSGHLLLTILTVKPRLGLSEDVDKLFGKINLKFAKENLPQILANCDEMAKSGSSSYVSQNSAIATFTVDLVESASKKIIDRATGRENELYQMIDILCRRKQNNPILVGEAGVGKTAIVEELAYRINENLVPDNLKNCSLKVLDLAALQAGANIKGEFEQRLKNIINEIKQSPNKIVLFIDEIHNIVGAGNSTQNDAANLLKPELARGEISVIGATTWAEYKKYFEKDSALNRRFQLIKVNEPSENEAISIVRNIASLLEQHHRVKILESAVLASVKLSTRYLTNMQLPDKAISLLDSACTKVRLQQSMPPLKLKQLEEKVGALTQHIERLRAEHNNLVTEEEEGLIKQKDQSAKEYEEGYKLWKEQLEFEAASNKEANQPTNNQPSNTDQENSKEIAKQNFKIYKSVDYNVVATIVSSWTGIPIPVDQTIKNELEDLLGLDLKIKQRVIGQDHATEKIVKTIRVAKANMSDPRKPIGVFLLVGESGVGKTETALSLAQSIYGSDKKIITINMSEYKEAHKVSSLIGSPPGYVGYGEGGRLTEQVRRSPYSVLLLDEMEKAHPDVQELFLQVFDKGSLTDSEGLEVNFKNIIILMTSNLSARKIADYCQKHKGKKIDIEDLTSEIKDTLLGSFKPEFLGRINVIPYLSLTDEILAKIIEIQMAKIKARLKEHYKAEFSFTAKVTEQIASQCKNSKIGARVIEHLISDHILPELSLKLLELVASGKAPKSVLLDIDKSKKFIFNFDC